MDEYRIDGLTVKEHLLAMEAQGNKAFTESLHPGVEHVLGIRLPQLRRLASRIAKGDWENYLFSADTFYMEERMLQGIVLGAIRPDADIEVYLNRVTRFVRIINSWSVCDTFTFGGGEKFLSAHRERLWQYLLHWMHTEDEYTLRFGVVMTLRYFVDEAHLPLLLHEYDSIRHEGYYVRMAVAWALSVCFVKFPEQTMAYLQGEHHLDDFTYRKTLQKILESYRVDAATKQRIREMRPPKATVSRKKKA